MKPILVIDPGHGGKDPGGGSTANWKEKDFVLQISLYQYERFKQLGVPVALTRDKDVYLSPNERAKIVRESGAKYCISNHINAAGNSTARGVETIHSIYSDGKLAAAIYNAIRDAGMPGRRVFSRSIDNKQKVDYYFMHRDTGSVSTVIVEYGFATNAQDVQLLENHWRDYAEAVVRAFCQYAGYDYRPPTDGKEDWRVEFARAREWAVEQGISDGSRPRDPITREEAWVMLYRALRK